MKAAVFYGKHDLRIEEKPIPTPGENEVLLRVKACGICGTDHHIFNGEEGAAATPPGTVLGHEFAGEVISVGAGVTNVKPGDRVAVDPNKLCGKCSYCLNGIGHFCESMVGVGTTVDGGFENYCVAPASQAYKFSDSLSYEKAAMTEPLSCCLHGIDLCDIQCGSTVAVIGCGMIGLLMLQLARLRGAAKLIALEPVAEKREMAKKLGADIVIDSVHEDVQEALRQAGVDRIETVIECVGRPSTMEQAISIAGKRSTVMLFGLTAPQDTITVKPFELFKKEIVLKASYINPYTFERALKLIESGKVDVSSMIYKTEPLHMLPEFLQNAHKYTKGKIIIRCDE